MKEGKPIITVLTGAGMSAESGLSTFRDSDGLWAKYRIEEVCTPEALRSNPKLVVDFYNMRRQECAKAQPNAGHRLLAALEKDYDVRIVTQNVDDLHERAGSTQIVHLHGELFKCASVADPYTPLPLPDGRLEMTVEDKDEQGRMLRPFIVFFGEQVPRLEEGAKAVAAADVLLIIGTSLQVYPASGLIHYAKNDTPIYLIDPNEVNAGGRVHYIRSGASEGVQKFVEMLDNLKL